MDPVAAQLLGWQPRQQAIQANAIALQQAQAQQQAQQSALAARAQAGQVLYDQLGGAGMPPPPPPPQAAPSAPPPGSLSPGGGNPQVMPPGGGVPPPPMMQQQAPQPPQGGMQRTAMPVQAPPPIQPFRPMPSAPAGQPAPGQVPPPPAAAAPAPDAAQQPHPMDLKSIIGGLQKSGVPADKVMDMLDSLAPVMNAQNKQELEFFKANNAALKAANDAYAKVMTAMAARTRAETGVRAEERRTDHGQQNIDIKKEREARLRAAAAQNAGGAGNLKTTELVYPKGADGRPDETQAPIGVRGVTKTGKIVNLDADGKPTAPGAGGTAKEAKDTKTSGQATVRANLVKSGVTNALARLDEIEKMHPSGSTSSFFGQHGDNPLTRGAYGAAKGMQSKGQQDIDAKWASMIDEAIPVFTGGLRGSDAFRRFLIEQAPGPGDKPETIKEKMRLFRQNIQGTSKAFFGKFQSDPSMWAPGVTKEEVAGTGGAAPQQSALPAGVPQGSTVIGKTPEGKDVYKAPDGKNYTAD